MPDQIDRMLSAIEADGSCIELRMQSGFTGCETGHREMVSKLRSEAQQRLQGERLSRVLEALNRLSPA